MAAYVIVQVEITDWDKFREYLTETPRTIVQFGGRYIARAGETVKLEGEESLRRIVIIEFPSLQHARDWYRSEEYQRVKALRTGAAIGSLIAIEGC
jgi:uncharacterized protein (DUF1330 family)